MTPVTRGAMTIETVRSAAGLFALKREWTELLRDSDADGLFLTWEWLATWWKHLANGRPLSVLVVRRGGAVEAIAPLLIRPAGWSSALPFPSLGFLGTGSVGSDYLDMIVRRGREARALGALAEALSSQKLMLEVGQVRREGSSVGRLAGILEQRGWTVERETSHPSRFINLRNLTWDSYLAGLGREHRYNFRRRLRTLERAHAMRFEAVRAETGRREALHRIIDLHNRRWQERGGSNAFHTERHLAFHEEVSRLACERGWLRLFLLHLDGRPAAGLYGFRYGDTFYFYQSGFDPALARLSAGMVTMGLAIKSALEEGAGEYDLLQGAERYKELWARDSRDLTRFEIYPPQSRGAVYRRAVELSRAAKRAVRRVLTKKLADRLASRCAGTAAEGGRFDPVAG